MSTGEDKGKGSLHYCWEWNWYKHRGRQWGGSSEARSQTEKPYRQSYLAPENTFSNSLKTDSHKLQNNTASRDCNKPLNFVWGSHFRRFQSLPAYCSISHLVRPHILVRVCDKTKLFTSWSRCKKRKEGLGFHCTLLVFVSQQLETFYWAPL